MAGQYSELTSEVTEVPVHTTSQSTRKWWSITLSTQLGVVVVLAITGVVFALSPHTVAALKPLFGAGSIQRPRNFILSRPAMLAGLQTKAPRPVYFSMLYHEAFNGQNTGFLKFREVAQYDDRLVYRLSGGDGVNFGQSEIIDTYHTDLNVTSTWVRPEAPLNDAFGFKVKGEIRKKEIQHPRTSVIAVYMTIALDEGDDGMLWIEEHGSNLVIKGNSTEYGSFQLRTASVGPVFTPKPDYSYLLNRTTNTFAVADKIKPGITSHNNHNRRLPNTTLSTRPNMAVIQLMLVPPFQWEVVFENTQAPVSPLFNVDSEVVRAEQIFDKQFSDKFSNITDVQQKEFGKIVLSHLLSGISYYYGDRSVKDPDGTTRTYTNSSLYSMIPAKMGFPRPFFWDEAFHEMVACVWDNTLFENVTRSWFDLQDENGWIAREQIIGEEARSRSPEWAWPGLTDTMNPPIYILTIYQCGGTEFKKELWPKLKLLYNWYKDNLKAPDLAYSYRWNGREGDISLDSGLDDYPRAPTPSKYEKNADIQSYMVRCGELMRKMALDVGDPTAASTYAHDTNMAQQALDLFWSEELNAYVDIVTDGVGHVVEYVHHIGVPSYLPICLGIETNITRISRLLNIMGDETKLYGPAGILSLSRQDTEYVTTGNYWRGNVWINMEYLCLQGLNRMPEGQALKERVKTDAINTMMWNYYERADGSIFETYHPEDGWGYNNVPFTGWSTLVLLMMSGDY